MQEVASVNDINLLVTTSVYIEMIWHDPRIAFTSNDTNIDFLNLVSPAGNPSLFLC